MKKIWICILSLVLVVVFLSGCSALTKFSENLTKTSETESMNNQAENNKLTTQASAENQTSVGDNNSEGDTASTESIENLPRSYDLRTYGKVPQARNQGLYGTCWAFASLGAVESVMMPKDTRILSPDHMSINNSLSVSQYDGGEYTMSMAYLLSWQGPVLETDDPYGDGYSPDNLVAVKHVQEVQIIGEKSYKQIKEAIIEYGGVQSSMYTLMRSDNIKSEYYNINNNSYCYKGYEEPNHDVVIIGWDDDYPKENFSTTVAADGAFIVLTSWGEDFGEGGVFYVSYEDSVIGDKNEVYTSVEDADNFDNIYQSDLCGWIGQIGYGTESEWSANVYTARTDETLKATGFYITSADTKVEAYVVKDVPRDGLRGIGMSSFDKVGQGAYENIGYYTLDFDKDIVIKADQRFAVVLKIESVDSEHPMAIEYSGDKGQINNFDIDDGEGYISYDGKIWESAEKKYNCNLCIKAYSDNR